MVYVALLRGINVGGRNLIKMADLVAIFEKMGFKDVKSFIQSGNIVFQSARVSELTLARKIEAQLLKSYGFQVPTVIRTAKQLDKIIQANPFLRDKRVDASKFHVTFLSQKPNPSGRLPEVKSGADQFRVVGTEIFLVCPDGYGQTKLINGFFEKHLGVAATTRNWKTILSLFHLMTE